MNIFRPRKFAAEKVPLYTALRGLSKVVHVGYDRIFISDYNITCAYSISRAIAVDVKEADATKYDTYGQPDAILSYDADSGALALRVYNLLHIAMPQHIGGPDTTPRRSIRPRSQVVYHKFCKSYLIFDRWTVLSVGTDLKSPTRPNYQYPTYILPEIPSEYSECTYLLDTVGDSITIINPSGTMHQISLSPADISTCIAYRPNSCDTLTCVSNRGILNVDPWSTSKAGHSRIRIDSRWATRIEHADHNICALWNYDEISVADLRYGHIRTISARASNRDAMWCATINGSPIIFSRVGNTCSAYI